MHWDWAVFRRDESSRYTDLSPVVRRRLPCIWWQKYRREAVSLDLSMQSTHSIRHMRRRSVLISIICISPSRTTAQKAGGEVAFIDAEHALDITYARALGVKVEDMLVSQPDTGEQALEITETMVRSGAIDIVIVDSVAALVPKAEIDGEMGDSHVGLQARLMSQALRKLTAAISRSNCIVIFINQLREKVGIMFGNPEVTTGGRALKFYSSVRMDVRRIESLKQGGEVIGNRVRIKVVKNKIAPPFREAEFDIMFGKGISREGDILDLAAKENIVEKSGAWYAYEGSKIGQGRENAKNFLAANPEICLEIENKVRVKYGLSEDTMMPEASKEAPTELPPVGVDAEDEK